MLDTYEHPQITIYSLSTQDIRTRQNRRKTCMRLYTNKNHPKPIYPKLLILVTKKEESFTTKCRLTAENPDIFAYINFKFVYVFRKPYTLPDEFSV